MAKPDMSDEEALHWLPPGWTEKRYANATDEDWEAMSDEVSYCLHVLDPDISRCFYSVENSVESLFTSIYEYCQYRSSRVFHCSILCLLSTLPLIAYHHTTT